MLAESMATFYKTEFVPEVAREMITSNQFTVDDIIAIGYAQIERINEKILVADKLLFCDTDTITTQIYSQHYLGVVPEELFALEKQVEYDTYFLMDIDVPWIPDGLRDLGRERNLMMKKFKEALDQRGISYTLVSGTYAEREEIVRREIDLLLS